MLAFTSVTAMPLKSAASVTAEVSSRKWTHWFQLPFVDYGDAVFTGGSYVRPDTAETVYTLGTRTLKNGSKGTDVKAMQGFLLQLEYSLPKYGADGEFGSETEKALKTFQRKIGIKQDGLYGSETHQALMDAVADDDEGKTDSAPDTEATEEVAPAVKQVRIVCGSGSVNIRVGNDTKYIDNTKPICYNIAKKNSHVVLISVSEVFIWQTAKTETSLLTALWAL